MSEDKIKNVQKAIKVAKKKQSHALEKMNNGEMPEKEIPILGCWLEYESMILNLETQEYVLDSIRDTDKITTLAYRVALISLGASLISIVSNLIG